MLKSRHIIFLEGKKVKISFLVMVAIFLVVGFAFLPIVTDTATRVSSLYQVNNETFAGVQDTEVATAYLPIYSVITLANSTNSTMDVATYNVTSTGISVGSGTATYFVTYIWEDALYNDSRAIQAIAWIFPLLYILIILLGCGMIVYLQRNAK
jgi:hypothetical protein